MRGCTGLSGSLKIDVDLDEVSWSKLLCIMRNLVSDGVRCYVTRRGLHFRHDDKPAVFALRVYYGDDESRIYWDWVRERCGMHWNVLFDYKVCGRVYREEPVSVECLWDFVCEVGLGRFLRRKAGRRRKF